MGEQRRGRGRGRSGRGGRIPRKGESQGFAPSEEFVSFPLEVTGPIRVASPADPEAVGTLVKDLLFRERALVAALGQAAQGSGDPALGKIQVEAERHRDTLEQLARDLGADVSGAEPPAAAGGLTDLLAGERTAQAGWQTLQRAAYLFGDKRIDRVVKPVLREKARHLEVVEGAAVRDASRVLIKELEY